MILTLPETARSISGNGSFSGRSWHRVPTQLLLKNRQTKPREPPLPSQLTPRIPNPLKSLRLLLYPDTLPIILINSLTYTTYCCLQVSLSTLFIDLYSYTALQAGLVYLPFGIGCLISSFLSGKLMDYDYQRTAAQVCIEVDLVRKTDLLNFPIEKARFRSMWWIVAVGAVAMGAYGWVLEKKVHPSVPLILQFILGATTTLVFNLCGTLLVDLHPIQPATAQASLNLIRCSMSAAGLAALQPLIDKVGVGWCYSVFAVILGVGCLPLCWGIWRWGMRFRVSRMGSEAEREKGKGERKWPEGREDLDMETERVKQ